MTPPDPKPLIDQARQAMQAPPVTAVECRPVNPAECVDLWDGADAGPDDLWSRHAKLARIEDDR